MADKLFDNSGQGQLRVPGVPGVPVNYELPYGERFAHGAHEWCQMPGIAARELAMTAIINNITDKTEWYRYVHDERIVSDWKADALQQHQLISDKAWQWCLAELRDKAVNYQENNFVRVLDTGSCVCKSDQLLDSAFADSLKTELDPLFAQHRSSGSRSDLVDPYMYPFIFGATRVLEHGCVKLAESYTEMEEMLLPERHTVLSTSPVNMTPESDYVDALCHQHMHPGRALEHDDVDNPKRYSWSTTYQCLPCDVRFSGTDTSVRIMSYINNLHPLETSVYTLLETLLAATIGMWNECLISGPNHWQVCSRSGVQLQRGGYPLRIVTEPRILGDGYRETLKYCLKHRSEVKYWHEAQAVDDILEDYPNKYRYNNRSSRLPARSPLVMWPDLSSTKDALEISQDILKVAEDILDVTWLRKEPDDSFDRVWDQLEDEVERRSVWQQPEPGTFFSYDEWKAGRKQNGPKSTAHVLPASHEASHLVRMLPGQQPHPLKLEKSFSKNGIQVVFRVGEICLAPGERYEKSWQLEGHLNEHIVATAIYAYDVSNVDCLLSFRQETPTQFDSYDCDNSTEASGRFPRWLGDLELLATLVSSKGPLPCRGTDDRIDLMQGIGHVSMPHNRLVAFPNTVERCVEARTLDISKSGHFRSITMHLVDPHYRIYSTRNVPPQQSSWWAAAVARVLLKKLPTELVSQILQYYSYPVSTAYAEAVRADMIKEQQYFTLARHADNPEQ